MGGDERPFLRISGVKKRAIDLVGGDGPRSADLLDPISKRKRKKTALLDCARKLHPPLVGSLLSGRPLHGHRAWRPRARQLLNPGPGGARGWLPLFVRRRSEEHTSELQ